MLTFDSWTDVLVFLTMLAVLPLFVVIYVTALLFVGPLLLLVRLGAQARTGRA